MTSRKHPSAAFWATVVVAVFVGLMMITPDDDTALEMMKTFTSWANAHIPWLKSITDEMIRRDLP